MHKVVPAGYHLHVCPKCGLIWAHPDSCIDGTFEQVKQAHRCPNPDCDGYEAWKDFGNKKPDLIFNGPHKPGDGSYRKEKMDVIPGTT